jgi:Na+/proline symporter
MAIFTSAVFGFQIWQVIVVIGAVVVFYSTTGGSWAVMATDFVQSLIMIPLTVVIGVICLIEVGGMTGLNQLIAEAGLSQEYRLVNSPDDFPVYAVLHYLGDRDADEPGRSDQHDRHRPALFHGEGWAGGAKGGPSRLRS